MKKIKALIWKEWREARLFVCGIIILMIAVRVGMALLNNLVNFDYEWFLRVIGYLVFPVGFSFLGCFGFSNEFTQETEEFLFSQSIGKKGLFWIKLFSGSILLLLLLAVSFLLFYQPAAFNDNRIIPIALSVLSLYFSMILAVELIRKPLAALFFSPFILFVIIFSVLPVGGLLNFTSETMLPEICLLISIIGVASMIIAAYLWNRSIVRKRNGWLQFLKCWLLLFIIVWSSHFIILQYSEYRLNSEIENLKTDGLEWGWTDKDIADKKQIKKKLAELAQIIKKLELKYKLNWQDFDNFVYKDFNIINIQKNKVKAKAIIDFLNDSLCHKFLQKFDVLMRSFKPDVLHGMNQSHTLYHIEPWGVFISIKKISKLKICFAFQKNDYAGIFKNYHRMLQSIEWEYGDVLYWKSRFRDDFLQKIVLNLNPNLLNSQARKEVSAICHKKLNSDAGRIQNIADRLYTNYQSRKTGRFGFEIKRNIRINPRIIASFLAYVIRPVLNKKTVVFVKKIEELQELQRLKYYQHRKHIDSFQRKLFLLDWGSDREPFRFLAPHDLHNYLMNKYENEYWMQMTQITLALKLYKAEHGQYPDSLDQLTPDILPEISVNPITGKVYNYEKKGEGCVIFSENRPKKVKCDSSRYSYNMDNIKYGRVELDLKRKNK